MKSSRELIGRAEHALRTGQPNLAMTYLRAADASRKAERAELVHEIIHLRLRRTIADARALGNVYADAVFAIREEAERTVRDLAAVLAPLYPAVTR